MGYYNGIFLRGALDCSFENVNISTYDRGICCFFAKNLPEFWDVTISDVNEGYFNINSPSIIINNNINSYLKSINLNNCPNTMIALSQINSEGYGIAAYKSSNLRITHNYNNNESSFKGFIHLLECPYSRIAYNTVYNVERSGISAYLSNNLEIDDNEIYLNELNPDNWAIAIAGVNYAEIKNNKINMGGESYGIVSEGGMHNTISENIIRVPSVPPLFYPYPAIYSLGSSMETCDDNTINGSGNNIGLSAKNSMGNTYSCNTVSGNVINGLSIGYNSEYHDIKGNEFISCLTDLSIKSRVGKQEYQGNLFHNGTTDATALNDDELEDSRFFVNSTKTHHMPDHPNPGNELWFIDNKLHEDYYDDCEDKNRDDPWWKKIFDDKITLNDFFNDIKTLQMSAPEQFFVKTYHLLEFDANNDEYSLPDFIKNDPAITNTCGLVQLADIIEQIKNISELSEHSGLTEADIHSIDKLQTQYISETDENGKKRILNDIRQLSVALMPKFELEMAIDSVDVEALKRELQMIDCPDEIVRKWKNIYIKYIDFIQTGKVVEDNKNALTDYSRECSDIYGDAIHLARSLTMTFDNTNYDIYDGCLDDQMEPRFNKNNTLNATVQPNPTKGELIIYTEVSISGKIELMDLSGRILYFKTLKNVNNHKMSLNVANGIYLLNIITDSGDKYIKKIVISK